LFRLNGWTRSFAEVSGHLLLYSKVENNLFSLPDFETMMSYKIVVTTCRDAEMLVQARLTNEALIYHAKTTLSAIAPELSNSIGPSQLIHWTALLLDEAAQAIEPEALIPLSVVDPASSLVAAGAASTEWSHPAPQFVMAGDEYQLGPRLSLKSASPLSTSLFARLFARPLYRAHPLSRANSSKPLTSAMLPILRPMFTNLIRNYRSHPAILTVPSTLFYADTLIAECTTLSEVVRTWPGWRAIHNYAGDVGSRNSACWPVLFIDNTGSDALESILAGNGTGAGGLFNATEAAMALRVVKSLLSHMPPLPAKYAEDGLSEAFSRIQPREIVVMTPFRAQVNYLRTTFREAGLYDVNIGPLEAFQGLESRIVVLCTTRTRLGTDDQGRDRFVREDQAKGFGVIGEPKRFNVAITRAKEGLIVIGNKECLVCTGDEAWVEFLAFCGRNGKTRQRLPTSHTQRQGRLERALRYAEDLARKADEVGNGVDGISERPPTGFGYPERQRPSMHRLRGNMLSLDEDMYREGMKIVDEMRDCYEADDGTTGDGDYDKLGCCDNGHEGTAQASTKHARHTQLLPLTSTQSRARKAPFLKRSPR
jgi:helicase MOV-10